MSITLRRLMTCVLATLCVGSYGDHMAEAQEPVLSDGVFRQATSDQKKKALNDIVLQRVSPSPIDLQAVLRAGLEDAESEIRARALSALGGRAQGERFRPTEEMRARWRLERQALLGLRGDAVRALEDPHELVRRDAIFALLSLDYEVGGPRERFALSPDTLQRLVDVARRDRSPAIRGQIMGDLALNGDDSPVVAELMISALHDQPANVEDAALWLATVRRIEALPRLAELLTHPDQRVRLAVSQTVAAYGELATPYLPQVENAARAETDPIVKKTLEGTRSLLMQARAAQTRPK